MRTSFRSLAGRLALLAVASLALLPGSLDPDAWWHLRLGRDLLAGSGSIVGPEPLSFMSDGAFVDHSWLHGVLLALATDAVGLVGMSLVGLLPYLVIFAAADVLVRRSLPDISRFGRAAVLAAIALAGLPTLFGRAGAWDPAFALVILVVAGSRHRFRDAAIPPVLALWAMLHGAGLPLVPVILGAIAAERLLVGRSIRGVASLVGAGLAGLLLLALLPGGLDALLYPFSVITSADQRAYISEWRNLFTGFDGSVAPFLLVAIPSVVGLALGGWRRVTLTAGILALVFGLAFFVAFRWILLAAFVAGPLIAAGIIDGWRTQFTDTRLAARVRVAATALLISFAVVGGGSNVVSLATGINDSYAADVYPDQAAAELRRLGACGNTYTTYAWGGYLAANALDQVGLYGEAGALEAGGVDLGAWLRAEQGETPILALFAAYEIDRAIVENGWPVDQALARSGWIERYRAGSESAIWDRPGSACAAQPR